MPNPLAIDAHAHICTEETMNLLNKEIPKVASSLKEYEKDVFEWSVCGVPYRPLPRGGFDIEQRLKDMKASDVDMQVLSNTPKDRGQLAGKYRDWFGQRWWMLPNPSYGSWEPAVFNNDWAQPLAKRRAAKRAALDLGK